MAQTKGWSHKSETTNPNIHITLYGKKFDVGDSFWA
jgi:hypothetical protein